MLALLFFILKGEDDVIMCSVSEGHSSIQRYYNDGKSPQIQSDPTLGLSNIVITKNNGLLRCQFNRTKHIKTLDGKYYSLFSPYFVLLAKGQMNGSNKCYFFILNSQIKNFN